MGTTRQIQITPLRRAIFEAGLTQRGLAELTGIHESDISKIVRGLHPNEDRRQKISNALGKTADELWPARRVDDQDAA